MLEWGHISSNWSYIKLENFEFKQISSLRKISFLILSLSLETSLLSFGSNFSSISILSSLSFLKIQTFELELHWVWNLSSKTCRVFKFRLAHWSTAKYTNFFRFILKGLYVHRNKPFHEYFWICGNFVVKSHVNFVKVTTNNRK